jgi:hypothetical protein
MYQIRILFIISLFLLSSCASVVEYKPLIISDIQKALIIVEKVINNNPENRGISLDLANERLMQLRGRLGGGQTHKTISYRFIGKVELYNKRDWYIVMIHDKNNMFEARFHFKNESNAKRLTDALNTLQKHKANQYEKYLIQVENGGAVKKIPSPAYTQQLDKENKLLKREIERLSGTLKNIDSPI